MMNPAYQSEVIIILVPEAALLLVSTKNRDLWSGPTTEVRDSRTSRHSAHAQSLTESDGSDGLIDILVPRAHDPSGLRQESRALGATILK